MGRVKKKEKTNDDEKVAKNPENPTRIMTLSANGYLFF